jgi:hypothetical protein
MYVPITSEVNIEIGTELKEISSGQLFVVAERLPQGTEVLGEDTWKIMPADNGHSDGLPLAITRVVLAEKYFAEVDA